MTNIMIIWPTVKQLSINTLDYSIPFIQYLRPNGRQIVVRVLRPKSVVAMALAVINSGCRFECEVLTIGQVSLTVSDGEVDIVSQLVPNGPDIPKAVDDLVGEAYRIKVGHVDRKSVV